MAKDTKDAQGGAKDAAKALKGQKSHLVLLLDESGSMGGNEEAVVTGVNEFLNTFRKQKSADVRVWLSKFDYQYSGGSIMTRLVEGKKVSKVDDLTMADYAPRGTTPLNDAILETIGQVEAEADKDRIFMVILTDGLENASEATTETVRKAIEKREKGEQWTFLYLGANQHAETTANQLGLAKAGTALNFTSSVVGTKNAVAYASSDAVIAMASPSKAVHEDLRAANYRSMGGVIDDKEEDKE